MLVQETVYEKVVKKIKERMKNLRLGHSLDKTIDMGAIVDPAQVRVNGGIVEWLMVI